MPISNQEAWSTVLEAQRRVGWEPDGGTQLMYYTGAVESLYKYDIRQNPAADQDKIAQGYWQVMPHTMEDNYRNWLRYRPEEQAVFDEVMKSKDRLHELRYNPLFNAMHGALWYKRMMSTKGFAADFPEGITQGSEGAIWLKYYNTGDGYATEEKFWKTVAGFPQAPGAEIQIGQYEQEVESEAARTVMGETTVTGDPDDVGPIIVEAPRERVPEIVAQKPVNVLTLYDMIDTVGENIDFKPPTARAQDVQMPSQNIDVEIAPLSAQAQLVQEYEERMTPRGSRPTRYRYPASVEAEVERIERETMPSLLGGGV